MEAITLFLAWAKTRLVQFGSGAIGGALAAIVAIVCVVLAVMWLRDSASEAAIATRDLLWTRKSAAATEKALSDQAARTAATVKAANDARASTEAELESEKMIAVEREREIARLITLNRNPVCIAKDVKR